MIFHALGGDDRDRARGLRQRRVCFAPHPTAVGLVPCVSGVIEVHLVGLLAIDVGGAEYQGTAVGDRLQDVAARRLGHGLQSGTLQQNGEALFHRITAGQALRTQVGSLLWGKRENHVGHGSELAQGFIQRAGRDGVTLGGIGGHDIGGEQRARGGAAHQQTVRNAMGSETLTQVRKSHG
ncbi:hypothetical protein D3C73_688210 [compost metagenome]